MARSGGLGKGLASLFPSELSEENDLVIRQVDVSHIYPNRYQPRTHFDEEALNALAVSISAVGIIQPIIVRETDQGYEIIAGERRWKAAQRAGLTFVPTLIRNSDDRITLETAIVENIQRENLNALEEAAAYRQLTDDFDLTQEQVARKVGRSRSAVANTIRLLNLPAGIQELIISGNLSAGHGRAILTIKGDQQRQRLAEEIVKRNLSVRDAEQLAVTMREETNPGSEADLKNHSSETDAGVVQLEELLTTRLGADVTVKIASGPRSKGQGKIIIQFSDLTDLERIYNVITPRADF